MKQRIIWLAIGVLVGGMSGYYQAPAVAQTSNTVGRYQLAQGSFTTMAIDTTSGTDYVKEATMFQIDTVTGQTWLFNSITVAAPAQVRRDWMPIPPPPSRMR